VLLNVITYVFFNYAYLGFGIIGSNYSTLLMPYNIGTALFLADSGFPFCSFFWGTFIKYFINPTGSETKPVQLPSGKTIHVFDKSVTDNIPHFYYVTAAVVFVFSIVGIEFLKDPPGVKSNFMEWLYHSLMHKDSDILDKKDSGVNQCL
jgi:hypothetical protein